MMVRQLINGFLNILSQISRHHFPFYIEIIPKHQIMFIDGNRRLCPAEFINAYVGDNPLDPSFELSLLLVGVNLRIYTYKCFLGASIASCSLFKM